MNMSPMIHSKIAAPVLAALILLCGCTGMTPRTEQPRVNLVALEVIDVQFFEQRYGVTLRIQNPDRADLQVEGISFELEINDREFAYGVSKQDVRVPGFSEALLDVEVVSTLFNVVDQLRDLEKRQGQTLSYRIHGKIALGGSLLSIPFEKKGVLGEPSTAPATTGSNRQQEVDPSR